MEPEVEDLYELSPLQQGMLFQSRYAPDSEVGYAQLCGTLAGALDVDAFRRAWQAVVDRHAVLRTSFHWDELEKPLQMVHRHAEVTLELHDWSAMPVAERGARLDAFLSDDRRRGFDLSHPPLLRLVLIRVAPGEHRWIWGHHHLLLDGWCLGPLLREVAAFYEAFLEGCDLRLPRPRPFADYIDWLQQQDPGPAERFWRQALAGFAAPTPLPADRLPGSSLAAVEGYDHREVHFPQAASAALQARARQLRVTPNVVVQAAWAVLLSRAAGEPDVVFGAVVAGRPAALAGAEAMIGPFINTLPVRARLDWGAPAADCLQALQAFQAGILHHEHSPLVEVQGWSAVPRGLPLFESLSVFENYPVGEALAEADTSLRLTDVRMVSRTHYALTLVAWLAPDLALRIAFDLRRFEAATVERLLGHLGVLLEALATDPERPVADLPLLSPAEREQALSEGLGHCMEVAAGAGAHALFEARVDADPAAPALRHGDLVWTYGELEARANRLARLLRRLGVVCEDLVGLCVERSPEMIAGVLAVLKAGGAYLPLAPDDPAERLAWIVGDARPRVLLTHRHLVERLPHGAVQVVFLEDAEDAALPADRLPATAGELNLAYVIYTSGSTGRPKGTLLAHRGLANLALAQIEAFAIRPGGRVLQLASFGFDASVSEIFTALSAGACLVLDSREALLPGPTLVRRLRDSAVTTATIPPSVLAVLPAADLPELETLVVAGEACPPDLVDRWAPGRRFLNAYGPTEGTVCATIAACRPGSGRPLLGRAMANVEVHVLDAALAPLPAGLPGELCLGGPGLARGYLGRPGLTAERFVPHPHAAEPGARLYRTGDLARRLPGGELDFLGRVDHQVKVRGFRIEPGEVETALRRHPGVREAVVAARPDPVGGHRLVAWLVPSGEAAPAVGELRRFLGESLPDFMIPTSFVALAALPLAPSDKVDRRALPDAGPVQDRRGSAAAPPRTPFEERLAAIWSAVLGVEDVGIHDNFFELGGDSIKAAVLINRLQEELDEAVYVVALFDAPTVADLADFLVHRYPEAVSRLCPGGPAAPLSKPGDEGPVGEADVAHLRSLIPPLPPHRRRARGRNPQAVFVVSPPRSGSTLLRVMLAGHPGIFAPPELELLSFDTLAERRAALAGRFSFWLEGTIRAIMEIQGSGADEAREVMEGLERRDLTVQEAYALFEDWVRPRLLVDKTPAYALDPGILRRAEDDFEDTLYIHLLRHPAAMVRSFVEARLDQVFFRHPHGLPARRLAELIWIVCHENICGHLATVPAARQHRIRFEELVTDPQPVLEGICAFLGLDFHPGMLRPYEDKQRKMTDGIHPLSKMLGDVKFHEHQGIDAAAAGRGKGWERQLGAVARELARRLGYPEARAARPAPRPRGAGEALPLSFAQQRLWFVDQITPGLPLYNLGGAFRLHGRLDAEALSRALAEVVRRHEVLRTRILTVDGEARQVVDPPSGAALRRLRREDLSGLPPAAREKALRGLLAEEARRPFDLEQGPLWRAALIRLGEDDHALALTLHHIVSDGWSQGILLRELMALYHAFLAGEPSPLPELPLQYADWALWQREQLQGDALAAETAWWRKHLAGAPAVPELPADRPRPLVPSFYGAMRPFAVSSEITAALHGLADRAGATLFMALLTAFQTLLLRWSGQTDVVVGSPVAGRHHPEVEGLIGLFVNTLALRTDLGGDPPFQDALRRTREAAVGAYAHQELPFEKLVDEILPERSLSHTPLFQVAFSLQNLPAVGSGVPGLSIAPIATESGTAKFDLTLIVTAVEGGLAGVWEYAADLFDAATVDRFGLHLVHLLAAAVTAPQQRLSELEMLSSSERHQILREWSAAPSPAPELPLDALFSRQVRERPEALAVIFSGGTSTYSELDRRANRLANLLRSLGVGPEIPVGLFLESSLDLLAATLGTLKAGGVYVPLDPSYPPDRLRAMVEQAGLRVAVTRQAGEEVLSGLGLRIVRAGEEDGWPDAAPDSGTLPESLAYIMFTSGSTGRPKGIGIPHRAIARLVLGANYVALAPGDRIALASNVSFDAATFEIWGALLNGGCAVGIPRDEALSPQRLARRLREDRVDTLFLTTALFQQIVQEEPQAFATLRDLLFGGQAVDAGRVRALLEGAPPERLLHVYGPTESTTFALWHPVSSVPAGAATIPIGAPLSGTEALVLGRNRELLPPGALGELHLGGDGLARGYLDPAATAERFVPHPEPRRPGERLYRTGDLVRLRPDGAVEFVGRVDQQVKIRGFRIEPAEIEMALAEHPGVRAAAVVARPAGSGDPRLIAYVVPAEPDAAGSMPAELHAFLGTRLPAFMIPAAVVLLAALPLTPNGKVDHRALPEPSIAPSGPSATPRTPDEELLARIWAQVLGVPEVGVEDNFFALGGDSILAIQVVARATAAGLTLTARDLFEHQTVAELAAAAGRPSSFAAEQGPITGEAPLTPIQRWFFARDLVQPGHFGQAVLVATREPLDPACLETALRAAVAHHDALRLRFLRRGAQWSQTHDAPQGGPLCLRIDLTAVPADRRRDALEGAAAELHAGFDLERGALFHAALFDLEPGGPRRLLLAAHHLVIDSVSWRILLEDLESAYAQAQSGAPVRLPAKTTSFRRWAELLAERAEAPAVLAELPFWLDGAHRVHPLPVDRREGENREGSARTVAVELAPSETRSLLQDVPRAYNTRIEEVLLTALVLAFRTWTGEPALLVDLEGHGRETAGFDGVDLSRTVGWFTCLYPVLLDPGSGDDPGQVLRKLKEQLRRVPGAGLGYGLLRWSQSPAAGEPLRELPPAEVSFNYLGQLDTALPEDGAFLPAPESSGPEHHPDQMRSHLLEIGGFVSQGALRLRLRYSPGRHHRATIEALAAGFLRHLRALVDHCLDPGAGGYTPSDFALAGVDEQDLANLATLLAEIDGTEGASA